MKKIIKKTLYFEGVLQREDAKITLIMENFNYWDQRVIFECPANFRIERGTKLQIYLTPPKNKPKFVLDSRLLPAIGERKLFKKK